MFSEILKELFDGPKSLSELSKSLSPSKPEISRQLSRLREFRLIDAHKLEKWNIIN